MEREFAGVEQQVHAEIEQLRSQFSETQELYREVCVLLFFRYGITPTANKLYQLVRKGSMSAPAEALGKFWSDLREKSRVRIEHPDLPEDLKAAAGDLTATLWIKAQSLAQDSLAAMRSEAQAAVVEAKAAESTAEARLETSLTEMAAVHHSLAQTTERVQELERSLATETALRKALDEQLRLAREDNASLQRTNDEARREFSIELDKLRALGQQAEERLRGAEERSLLEIERERQVTLKVQKELDSVRSAASQATEGHRSEVAALQGQIGNLRQQVGVLEGNLQAVTVAKNQLVEELDGARRNAANANAQVSVWQTEVNHWKERSENAEKVLAERPAPKLRARRPKPAVRAEK